MGYTTDFNGSLKITPSLNPEQVKYINLFSSTRRMARDPAKLQELYQGKHGFNGSYGPDGAYFALGDGSYGQDKNDSIIDFNSSGAMPGLWCQWVISEDGSTLEWDGGEKFYSYIEWLEFLIAHFFSVWEVTLNGEIEWRGEQWDDTGTIAVVNNMVSEFHK